MEKQTQENLLTFIKKLESSVELREKEPKSIIRTNYQPIHQLISNTRDYAESVKRLVFNKIVSLTYKREINIEEFNEINDDINLLGSVFCRFEQSCWSGECFCFDNFNE